jgi:hypothetical protein
VIGFHLSGDSRRAAIPILAPGKRHRKHDLTRCVERDGSDRHANTTILSRIRLAFMAKQGHVGRNTVNKTLGNLIATGAVERGEHDPGGAYT